MLVLIVIADRAFADDTVFLKSTSSRSSTKISGTITEYTGSELLIQTVGGREQMITADRIENIATTYTQPQVDADILFQENRFAEAEALYRRAVNEEPRQWVRRQIMAQVVWCLRSQNKHEQAAKTFLLVVQNDPTTQYFDAIPLAWRQLELDLAAERQASAWLRDDRDPVAQLIAASWLLSGTAELRGEAVRTLEDLTRTGEMRVAQLAESQLWRTRVVTAKASDIARWPAAIDRMPESLRGGSYHLLGQALARQQQYQQAALAQMRVPVLYPNERALSAEALLAAADALEKNKQNDEARNCLRELIQQHPSSTAAAAAKSKLSNVTTGG